MPVRHQGDMTLHGFVHREGTAGVVTWAVGASLWPIRFQARTLRVLFVDFISCDSKDEEKTTKKKFGFGEDGERKLKFDGDHKESLKFGRRGGEARRAG